MLNVEEEVFWTEKEFKQALVTLKKQVPRVLKKGGIFIAKIMDGYIGRKYYPVAFLLFNAISRIMEPKGVFICPIQKKDNISELIRANHIYYLVFKSQLL